MSAPAPRYWILDENGASFLAETRTKRPIGFRTEAKAQETADFYSIRDPSLRLTVTDKKPANPLSRRQQPEPAQEKRT